LLFLGSSQADFRLDDRIDKQCKYLERWLLKALGKKGGG